MIVILMVLVDIEIGPRVMLPHPGTGVEVKVGVNVAVGVNVMVGVEVGVDVSVDVGVLDGVNVGVLLGRGVKLGWVTDGSNVLVAVGVSDGVGVSVGVLDGVLVGTGVGVFAAPEPSETSPRYVRALDEVNVRALIGINRTIGS